MRIGPLLFWLIMVLWLVFGIAAPRLYRPTTAYPAYPGWVSDVLLFILLLIVGAHLFGIPQL